MDKCYICGSTSNLTKDHVPPQNLFPPPKPNDLITVPCCNKCNNSFSKDDEAFRILVASVINRSPAGDWAWKKGVVASSFVRSLKLKENVAKSLVPAVVETPTGQMKLSAITLTSERGDKYLTRLTKGLLFHFYPHINYKEATFEINQLTMTQELVDNVLTGLHYDKRGEQVFRFWYAVGDGEKEIESVWVYVFYDALAFTVAVKDLSIQPSSGAV